MREINPKDVPQLMRDGKLEFGMELEFLKFNKDEDGWVKQEFVGFNPNSNQNQYPFIAREMHYGSILGYKKARFPLPKLRDGDPVVVWDEENNRIKRTFKKFSDSDKFICHSDGLSRWTTEHDTQWEYGRPANKQELSKSGYTEDQINEMMERWGVK